MRGYVFSSSQASRQLSEITTFNFRGNGLNSNNVRVIGKGEFRGVTVQPMWVWAACETSGADPPSHLVTPLPQAAFQSLARGGSAWPESLLMIAKSLE